MLSIVQFSSRLNYAEEGETLDVCVMRIGGLETTCSVDYRTEDSPLEGSKFFGVKGNLRFEKGERRKKFELKFLDNEYYEGLHNEVAVFLENPQNCQLGLHADSTRIRMLDDDTFPTNKFKDEIRKDPFVNSWRSGNNFPMLVEFAKYCFWQTKYGSIKMICADQVPNLVYVSNLYFMRRLVNFLSRPQSDRPYVLELGLYALALACPYAITHLFSYRSQFFGVGGSARKAVFQNLMANFLFYRESERQHLDEAEWSGVYTQEAFQLIIAGYMSFFKLAAAAGRITLVFGFTALNVLDNYREYENIRVLLLLSPLICMPMIIYLYLRLRREGTEEAHESFSKAKIKFDQYANEVVNQYRTIADYWNRPVVMERVAERMRLLNAEFVHLGARQANNSAFFGWLVQIVELVVVMIAGGLVKDGVLEIGSFTSQLSALKGAATSAQQAYRTLMTMQSCYPALWKVVHYSNVPTGLSRRKASVKEHEEKFHSLIADEQRKSPEDLPEDKVALCLHNVSFCFPGASEMSIKKANLSIEQGTLVSIVGGPASGKSCLLRLLSDVLIPDDKMGDVFIPPHLRTLHLMFTKQIPPRPVVDSLFMGIMGHKNVQVVEELSEEEKDRGFGICKRLDLEEHVLDVLETERREEVSTKFRSLTLGHTNTGESAREVAKVARTLTTSVQYKIQLACALITDPQILVVHFPTAFQSENDARQIMKTLRAFVDDRGLDNGGMDSTRRPRTCIVSLPTISYPDLVDRILEVQKGEIK